MGTFSLYGALLRVSCLTLLGMAAGCVSLGGSRAAPLKVVDHVDLNRYVGTWYEIARYPAPFQRGCVGVTATYSFRKDGKISVLNKCRDMTLDGPERSAEGVAWVVDTVTNAKLKVRFFWPFSAPYWIIDLDENYTYAVVGVPNRKYLWLLSRTPVMEEKTYNRIIARLIEQGYDPSKLTQTPQVE